MALFELCPKKKNKNKNKNKKDVEDFKTCYSQVISLVVLHVSPSWRKLSFKLLFEIRNWGWS